MQPETIVESAHDPQVAADSDEITTRRGARAEAGRTWPHGFGQSRGRLEGLGEFGEGAGEAATFPGPIMSTVRKEIQALSIADRLQLLEEIWDSLVETPEAVPVTAAQRRELARRRRAHARNPAAAKSWAEVRARLRRRK